MGDIVHGVTRAVELFGIAIILTGTVAATAAFLRDLRRTADREAVVRAYRTGLGRAILLGLEFLVAADIINTVAIEPTLRSVAVLGGIVLIRTFLSFSLEVEIEGRWPWRRQPSRGAACVALMLAVSTAAPGCTPIVERSAATEVTRAAVIPDPLPSWTDGAAKREILGFVDRVTREGSPELVPAEARIATFDNDGTLWSEKPVYVQAAFIRDRVKRLAPEHPEWRTEEPFKAILEGEMPSAAATDQRALMKLLAATSAGMTTEQFGRVVEQWLATARHPRFDRPYTELVYEPMRELLQYLRANGFKTFIVSGGGADFIRPWAARAYGIAPEQVVGSRSKVKYVVRDGTPALERLPELDLLDDGEGKPVGIHQVIGRRPLAAFGNSDGDFEMLEWTTSGTGPRFGLLVHHTDPGREWAYDRDSSVGRLTRALDQAPNRGWVVVDMKHDWRVIYPFEAR